MHQVRRRWRAREMKGGRAEPTLKEPGPERTETPRPSWDSPLRPPGAAGSHKPSYQKPQGQLPATHLGLHTGPYLERGRLSSHYAVPGLGALQLWTPQVLTLLRRQSVGRGPHQAPKLVGVGRGRKERKEGAIRTQASTAAKKACVLATIFGSADKRQLAPP